MGKRGWLATATGLAIVALAACGDDGSKGIANADAAVASATVATQSGDFSKPLDAIPDPTGSTVYFTASSPKGPGVFKVAAGGGAAEAIAVGSPFVAPRGITLSADGSTIYVADPGADRAYSLPTSGTVTVAEVQGSIGTRPMGIEAVGGGRAARLYVAGQDPATKKPAVLSVDLESSGAGPEVLASGSPLVAPDSVTAHEDGTLYVSDAGAGKDSTGAVFVVRKGSAPRRLVDSVRLGSPGGVALTRDGKTLAVSALQDGRDRDRVLLVSLPSGELSEVTAVVGENSAAGGVHRAPGGELFAWADLTAGGTGRVYRIEFR